MGKNDRLSRDQKRKIKLKKREERSRKPESLAYHGRKYKTPEYVPILKETEVGIYECHVMSGRTLTDDAVEAALVGLIALLRAGASPALPPADALTLDRDHLEELVVECIRNRWHFLEERGELPARDDLIGILRTILSSLETWRSQNLHSQSYLRFLDGFMKDLGVSVQMVRSSPESLEVPRD